MARMQKARKAKEEALKEAGIDPTKVNLDEVEEDVDIDSKFQFKMAKKDTKTWILYPDGLFKTNWEKIMSL